jgi:hypothetical protein
MFLFIHLLRFYPNKAPKPDIQMKPNYLLVIAVCMLQLIAYKPALSQNIAINNSGNNPAASAMLDIQSSDKGLLIPQVNLTSLSDAVTIAAPANSLLVYNTNPALPEGKGYYYNAGSSTVPSWTRLASGAAWKPAGNAGTVPGTDFIGTTDARGLMLKTNNIQSGYIDLTGTQNTSFGVRSLLANGGLNNVAIGWNALKSNSMGNSNIAIGSNSLVLNKEGQNNIAIGSDALRYDSAGTTNVAVGGSSLYRTLGDNNTGIGNQVLHENSTGESNIAIGHRSGYYNDTASKQVFINSLDRLSYTGDTTASPVYIQQSLVPASQRIKLNGRVIMPNLPSGVGTKALRIDAAGNVYAADTTNFAGLINDISVERNENIFIAMNAVRPGEPGNQPAWTKIKDDGAGSRGLSGYSFTAGAEQEVFFSIQIPANCKKGSVIIPDLHWSTPPGDQQGAVVWGIEYSWIQINNDATDALPNTKVINLKAVVQASITNQQLVTVLGSIPAAEHAGNGALLVCRLFRKGNDAADTYPASASVLAIDFRFETITGASHIAL